MIEMKFFTKEWYNNMQRLGRAGSNAEWMRLNLELGIDKAVNDYRRHVKHHGLDLWDDELSFHDATIVKAEFDGTEYCIRLIWDKQDIEEGHYTEVRCENASVIKQECDIQRHHCWWLYEEVHPTENGYELHCLLAEYETGDLLQLIVAFQDMKFITNWNEFPYLDHSTFLSTDD